jgi:hypothetical protein
VSTLRARHEILRGAAGRAPPLRGEQSHALGRRSQCAGAGVAAFRVGQRRATVQKKDADEERHRLHVRHMTLTRADWRWQPGSGR